MSTKLFINDINLYNMGNILTILAQVKLEGFEETAQLGPLFGLLVSMVIILAAAVVILYRQNETKDKKLEKTNKDFTDKIDEIRKDQAKKAEEIRQEMIKKEEERNREWRESEKETLQVLNGVNSVLEMSEKMKMSDTKQIMDKLGEIKDDLETIINNRRK